VELFATCFVRFFPVVIIGSVINVFANKITGSKDGHFAGKIFLAVGLCMFIIMKIVPFFLTDDYD